MKKILGIILFLLCVVSKADADFRYFYNFEDDNNPTNGAPSVDALANKDNSPGLASNFYYSQAHNGGQRGSWTARAHFLYNQPGDSQNYLTYLIKEGFYQPATRGETIYQHIEIYFDSSFNWNQGPSSIGGTAIKFFRLTKKNGSDLNVGANSIMLTSGYPNGGTRPWFSAEYTDTTNPGGLNNPQHIFYWGSYHAPNQFYILKADEWNYVDLSWVADDVLTSVDMTVTNSQFPNGYHLQDNSFQTLRPDTVYYDRLLVFSTWNAGSPADQSCYVDNVYMSNINDYYSWKGGAPDPSPQPTPQPDDTPPTVVSVTPANGSGSVNIDFDPIFLIQVSDQESGNNASTARLTFNGNNESADLASSGDLSNTSFYLTNSNLNTPLTYSTGYSWDFGITDYLGNQMSESGNLTTEPEPVIGITIFATGDMGDQANYTEYSDNWQLVDESGDVVYLIDNSAYEGWEYTRYNLSTYQFWQIEGKFRCDDNLTTNLYADWVFIFNYVDHYNFDFVQFNSFASLNGVWSRENGNNLPIKYNYGVALVTDNNWHTFKIANNNGRIEVYVDGLLKYSTNIIGVTSSTIGFGSQNDQFAFDDIVITDISSQPSPPPQVSPTPSGQVYNKGGNVHVKSTGNRIFKR